MSRRAYFFAFLVSVISTVILTAVSATAASGAISSESQIKSIEDKKPTVCTITINSSDEKEVFQSFLGEDFNFLELTGGGGDWFERSCKKKVQCDVLVVSGHFGGSFFGSSGYRLSLNTLQRKSCDSLCDGILKRPKEVFLFGCNTTAGKRPDHRTPEEYTAVLVADGFSRRQAELISAFRYSPIGQQTQDKMRQIFPNSRIYGFHSQSPSGKNIRARLNNYFKSIPNSNYKAHLSQFPTDQENLFWSQAMKGQWIRSINGSKDMENPVCLLEDRSVPLPEKLTWVNDVLSDEQKSLAYIPVINDYFKDLEERIEDFWEKLTSTELSLMESIQLNKRAKEQISFILKEPLPGILSAQLQVLDFTRRIGWLNQKDFSLKLKYLLSDLFAENLDYEKKDFFCSLSFQVDLSLEDLPKAQWNKYTIQAIGCSRTSDIQVLREITQYLKDSDEYVRWEAAGALGNIKPSDPEIHRALVEALKTDTDRYVRRAAAWALGNIKPSDPEIHRALVGILETETDEDIRLFLRQTFSDLLDIN